MMEKIVFLEKDISGGGASMMQTVPRESHEHHLHGGHHVGGRRDTWNQPEHQYEKNFSMQPASDQLVTFLLPAVLVLPRWKGHLKPSPLPFLPHSHLNRRTLSRAPYAIWYVLISYLFMHSIHSVCVSVLISQFLPTPDTYPLGVRKFSVSVSLSQLCK